MLIDTALNMWADSNGKDPDFASPTLRRYHQWLWSKNLPNGECFELSDTTPGSYLYHRSNLGEFWLASDSIIATFTRWSAMAPIIHALPEATNEEFRNRGYTIGGFLLWPGNRIDGRWTINQARGCNRRISDRIDLTLECIRRHYLKEPSPISGTLARYADFFSLFGDSGGYIDFWLLQDFVLEDKSAVRFFMAFDDFKAPHVPRDIETYREYHRRSIDAVDGRNVRIQGWVAAQAR